MICQSSEVEECPHKYSVAELELESRFPEFQSVGI